MRTKGAVSNAVVKLSELNRRFQPDADIVISRKFAMMNGLVVTPIAATQANMQAVAPVEVDEPVSITEVE